MLQKREKLRLGKVLKMLFVLFKDLYLMSRDLNLAKRYTECEDIADFER